jgi:hypothetical protein
MCSEACEVLQYRAGKLTVQSINHQVTQSHTFYVCVLGDKTTKHTRSTDLKKFPFKMT